MVDFGSERGLSVFESGGIVLYFEDFKKAKTKCWTKIYHLWMDTHSVGHPSFHGRVCS
jgi:hypothetical protein